MYKGWFGGTPISGNLQLVSHTRYEKLISKNTQVPGPSVPPWSSMFLSIISPIRSPWRSFGPGDNVYEGEMSIRKLLHNKKGLKIYTYINMFGNPCWAMFVWFCTWWIEITWDCFLRFFWFTKNTINTCIIERVLHPWYVRGYSYGY